VPGFLSLNEEDDMTTGFTQPFFPFTVNFPSGDVDLNNWFSPRISVSYAGTPAIERDVVENVASFGDQLGTLIDAVVQLAADKKGEKLDDLRELQSQVDEVKARHKRDIKREAEAAIERLAELDEAALRSLLRRYA
jgi:hypothetical protein